MSEDDNKPGSGDEAQGIEKIFVEGFKSLAGPHTVDIRPLTLLAGANSSGKSSLMQPLLLLKQTLASSFDPGPLLLNDSHVRFTSVEQMLTRAGDREDPRSLWIGLGLLGATYVKNEYGVESGDGDLQLKSTMVELDQDQMILKPGSDPEELAEHLFGLRRDEGVRFAYPHVVDSGGRREPRLKVVRRRCFLVIDSEVPLLAPLDWSERVSFYLERTIHVPGLRGNPERTYRTSAVGNVFPGTFEDYVASIIAYWQREDMDKLASLSEALAQLGLTSVVQARRVDSSQVELQVGRSVRGKSVGASDLVNVADVGFGVSQVLPVLVALLQAEPGQLVYLEQPELHLHPRAQVALASVLADAARRGVRVVAETHSALLLLAVQALVAEEELDPSLVLLHWFQRNEEGLTHITTSELDQSGAYGDWPEDFAEVELQTQKRYLDAVGKR